MLKFGRNQVAKREDGKVTRRKLLNAACEVFAQKGYKSAKVADICKQAGANVASVNYYFGDKASLYKEAWQYALQNLMEPIFSELTAGHPQDLLRKYIQTLMQHLAAKDKLGQFSRLYLMELVNPTGLIKEAWHEMIEPQRRMLHNIIRAIIGPEAEELSILFCELSIANQCRALVTIKNSDLQYMLGQPLGAELIERLAHHIADFSLAGIKAVGKRTA
jgi:AcrR family transcriptional regulator